MAMDTHTYSSMHPEVYRPGRGQAASLKKQQHVRLNTEAAAAAQDSLPPAFINYGVNKQTHR